jgi:hypothetical protein
MSSFKIRETHEHLLPSEPVPAPVVVTESKSSKKSRKSKKTAPPKPVPVYSRRGGGSGFKMKPDMTNQCDYY